jgi:tetratricopeptide (TPR) repeat protein
MGLICLVLGALVSLAGQQTAWEQHMREANKLERMGRYQEALAAYELALSAEASPSDSGIRKAMTWNNMALVKRHMNARLEARQDYQRALEVFQEVRGASSPEYASVLHNLATLDHLEGQFDTAAEQFWRALKIREGEFGANHRDTAQTLNSLSSVYAAQGRFTEAEQLCRKALAVQETVLGTEHPSVSDTLDNLAWICWMDGRLEAALKAGLRSEQITQNVHGYRNSTSIRRSHKVAVIYGELGRLSEAEKLLRQLQEWQSATPGGKDTAEALTIANLAAVCFRRKRAEEAYALYQKAEQLFESERGPLLAAILSDHAWILRQSGRNDDADRIEQRSREILAMKDDGRYRFNSYLQGLLPPVGSRRPNPAQWQKLNDEGEALQKQGQCRKAIPVLKRAQTATADAVGPNHAFMAIPTNNLAAAYLCLGELTSAERHFREAMNLTAAGSPETRAGILNNYGVLLTQSKRMAEAAEVFKEVLVINEAVHGASHPSAAIALTNLGTLHVKCGEYEKARNLFGRSLSIWEASPGNDLNMATALNNLGVVSLYLNRMHEAMAFSERALDLRRKLLPQYHHDIAQSLFNYAVVLDRLGQRELARKAFKEAALIRSSFASANLNGLTVDVKALGLK